MIGTEEYNNESIKTYESSMICDKNKSFKFKDNLKRDSSCVHIKIFKPL